MTTNTDKRNSMLEKIQALLQKTTDRGATEAEAQAAILTAQKLMAKYHIEIAEIKDSTQEAPKILRTSTERKAMAQWSIRLLNLISDNFRCKSFLMNRNATFIGEEEDIILAVGMYKMLYDFMDRGTRRIRKQYRKQGLSTDGVADSYLMGFLKGLEEALNNQKKQEESKEGGTGSFAMILVTPEAVVKAHQEILKNSRTIHGRSLSGNDSNAYQQGHQEGRNSLNKRIER